MSTEDRRSVASAQQREPEGPKLDPRGATRDPRISIHDSLSSGLVGRFEYDQASVHGPERGPSHDERAVGEQTHNVFKVI
ncbi:MAG: hypothetical protein M3076_02605 [Actinomycetota bacterium]|nr:hypothetical protein [Actinomycetota bacterium]